MAATGTGAEAATDWLARIERFPKVGSTNDIVAGWLSEATPEVCIAIADEQLAGRGRNGRTWHAPAGSSLLLSAGFRPTYLRPEQAWRLAAIVSLAMAEAAEAAAWLPEGVVRLKWPNDLMVFDEPDMGPRKLAGVLGETQQLGTHDPRVVVGIGMNVNWFSVAAPADLATPMTDLSSVAGLEVPLDRLTEAFLGHLRPLVADLHAGTFPSEHWRARQLTSGSIVRLEWPDGTTDTVSAVDVDPDSGALLVRPLGGDGPARPVLVGEIRHLRVGAVV